jgi:D-proline reductase (dithiol) PrdB
MRATSVVWWWMMRQPNPAYRVPVSYIDKSRDYYAAHEYPNPYRWAYHPDVPFQPLGKPLAESRIGIVTTTTLLGENQLPADEPDSRAPKAAYAAPVAPPPAAMYTMDLSWDKDATHTDDVESCLPHQARQSLAVYGRIGSLCERL